MTAYYCLQCRERRPGPGRCRVCGSTAWTEDEVKLLLRPRERERFIEGMELAIDKIRSAFGEVAGQITILFGDLFERNPKLKAWFENQKPADERSAKEREE